MASMSMKWSAAAVLWLVAACSTSNVGVAGVVLDDEAAAAVREATFAPGADMRIAADLQYLADDDRQGREAGSDGYLEAAHYVAGRFRALGLEPGAGGDWFQTIEFRAAYRDWDAARLEIIAPDGAGVVLKPRDSYLIGRSLASERFDVSAPLVFAGYGVTDTAAGYDDYAQISAEGKIAVVFNGAPAAFDSERRAHFGSTEHKLRNAEAQGAVGLLIAQTSAREARQPWPRVIEHADSAALTWMGPDNRPDVAAPKLQAAATISSGSAAKMFEGAPLTYEAVREQESAGRVSSFDLPVRARLSGASLWENIKSPNVVAMLEGADPLLKKEVVVLSAHLDHIGVKNAGEGDTIYNGALDNAMGVALILEIARRFADEARPARTLVFLATTAEEKGMLGADYFAHYPPLTDKTIVANVNLDMPLLLHEFTDVIAFGASHTTIGGTVEDAAREMGIDVSPDPFPEEGFFTRSDHYRFVEQGAPSIFLFTGFDNGGEAAFHAFMRDHYHAVSDEATLPIDYNGAARFAALGYRIARSLADADQAPQWREGSFFGQLFDD